MSGKGKNTGGGGGGARVFISLPSGDAVEPGDESGKYNVTISVGQTHQSPPFAIPTKIFVQGKQVALLQVRDTKEETFRNIKLDPSKPLEVRSEKAGFTGQGDTLEIESKLLKDAKKKATSTPTHETKGQKRLEVFVGRVRPDGKNPVHFITKDESFKSALGTVRIDAGQYIAINGEWHDTDTVPIIVTANDGTAQYDIQLLEFDANVVFEHEESGERITKLLLKEN